MTLPLLEVLHLSANNLHGTISGIKGNVSALTDLTISNNGLTGTIPVSIQQHSFIQLDLSNNRLRGTLVPYFLISTDQTKLSLAVNRLSGPLPNTLKGLSSSSTPDLFLNVLVSNIFQCTVSDIPSLDESSSSYSCGSYELNVATYVWIAVFVMAILIPGTNLHLGLSHGAILTHGPPKLSASSAHRIGPK